jgi:2-polyprenyl-3-methyl-5-hydroxy-6-metoxy-1,4-benzoquinol methylase
MKQTDTERYAYSREYFETLQSGWNRISYDQIASFAREGVTRFSPRTVLDLGCGNGVYGPVLTEGGARLVGVDMAPESIAWCQAAGYDHVIRCPAEEIACESGKFDLVFTSEVLEHVEHYDRMLREIRRVLTTGGGLVLTTTCYAPSIYQFVLHRTGGVRELAAELVRYARGYRNGKMRREFVRRWCFAPLGGHYHGFFKRELSREVAHAGFEVIHCETFYAISPFPLFDNYKGRSVLASDRPLSRKLILLAGLCVAPVLNRLLKLLGLLGNNVVIIARKK